MPPILISSFNILDMQLTFKSCQIMFVQYASLSDMISSQHVCSDIPEQDDGELSGRMQYQKSEEIWMAIYIFYHFSAVRWMAGAYLSSR